MIVKLGSLISEYSVRNKADEDIPVYSVTNEQGFCTGYFSKEVASQDRTTYKIVPRGCFAYNPSRINVGSVDVQECEDRVIVSPLYVVFSVDEKLNRRYLLHYLKSDITLTYIKAYASGSVRDNLKFSILKDFPINLPSAEEQGQIVATLDGIEHLIALRKEEIASLDELVKSRFIELFGDPVLNQHGWRKVALEVNATLLNGRAYKQDELLDSGKYPVLRVGNFFSNRGWYYSDLELDDDKYCDNGDLLYAWSASFGPQIWNGGKVIYHYHIWKVLVGEAYNKQFLCKLLEYATESLMGDTHGIAMMHLTKSGMEKTEFIVPPIERQEQFAAFVEQTDKSKLAVQNALEELEILKKSLMKQYFG